MTEEPRNAYGEPVILPGASRPGGILVRDMVVKSKAEREAEREQAAKERAKR